MFLQHGWPSILHACQTTITWQIANPTNLARLSFWIGIMLYFPFRPTTYINIKGPSINYVVSKFGIFVDPFLSPPPLINPWLDIAWGWLHIKSLFFGLEYVVYVWTPQYNYVFYVWPISTTTLLEFWGTTPANGFMRPHLLPVRPIKTPRASCTRIAVDFSIALAMVYSLYIE